MNVIGDSIGAGIVAHLSRHDLAKQDQEQEERERQEQRALEGVNVEDGHTANKGTPRHNQPYHGNK